ncbi:MAG: SRPBCC domain-containing protein [Alphaproteobacteria bacterium]|nr:SRPBCC domain-containing protein [Alphaproteobacteria bacterium]
MAEPFIKTMRITCSIEHAFTTFTQQINLWWPPNHRKFEGSTIKLETHIGGSFYEVAPDGQQAILGEVLSLNPPFDITYTWNPGKITKPTQVTISFTQDDDETIMQVTHIEADSALGDKWPQRLTLFTRGWQAVFTAYADFIKTNL